MIVVDDFYFCFVFAFVLFLFCTADMKNGKMDRQVSDAENLAAFYSIHSFCFVTDSF